MDALDHRPGRRSAPVRTFAVDFAAEIGSSRPSALAIGVRLYRAGMWPASSAHVQEAVDASPNLLFGVASPTIDLAVGTARRLAGLQVTGAATPDNGSEWDIQDAEPHGPTLADLLHRGLIGAALGSNAVRLTRMSLSQHHPSAAIEWVDGQKMTQLWWFGDRRHERVDVRFEAGPLALAALVKVVRRYHGMSDALRRRVTPAVGP